VFLHTVHEGPASQSYGLQVAKLAGVPHSVIQNARQQLSMLEQSDNKGASPLLQTSSSIEHSKHIQDTSLQSDMFAVMEPSAVETALHDIDPDGLTPRQALDELYRLKALSS